MIHNLNVFSCLTHGVMCKCFLNHLFSENWFAAMKYSHLALVVTAILAAYGPVPEHQSTFLQEDCAGEGSLTAGVRLFGLPAQRRDATQRWGVDLVQTGYNIMIFHIHFIWFWHCNWYGFWSDLRPFPCSFLTLLLCPCSCKTWGKIWKGNEPPLLGWVLGGPYWGDPCAFALFLTH